MPRAKPIHRNDFGVAIICALPLEYDAVSYVLDEFWDEDGDQYGRADGDPNSYTTGRMGDYDVVIALLPREGKASAASAAASMRSSYPRIRVALLVGVCGGVPHHDDGDVFLGDVVISSMVVQYDFGRLYPDKFLPKDTVKDSLGRPNKVIRNLVATFQTDRGQDKLKGRLAHFLHQLQGKVNDTKRQGKYDYPAQEDQLFKPGHRHRHYSSSECICRDSSGPSDPVCDEALSLPCAILGCDDGSVLSVARSRSLIQADGASQPPQPQIHVGVVASGDLVLKSAMDRERLQQETKAVVFEMEGAGVWDEIPCIVIKGVCDYADSHKHKGWQNYAAATAASASKAVLERYILADRASAERNPIHRAPGPISTIPFPPDPNYVERPSILKWIQRTLIASGCRAALVGLGGVGKSQIAIQYAHEVRRTNPDTFILWVHASSRARFKEAYQDIAERLKLRGRDDPQQSVLQLVCRWLSDDENGPWLMIIDNADDGSILFSSQSSDNTEGDRSLASHIPKTGRGSVLVTSRSSDTTAKLVRYDCIYQVPAMDQKQAMHLLNARLGKLHDEDSDAAGDLLVALDFLPLAIIQATSYIQRRSARGVTIAAYLSELSGNEQKKKGLLKREADDLRRDESASNAVLTTWQITFEQVRCDRASAADLLCFMSFFNPQGIPDYVLEAFSQQDAEKDLEDDIEVLRNYSLITAMLEYHTLEMHALVQLCTQAWLSTFDDIGIWRSKYLHVMSSQYPYGEYKNRIRCRELDPHVEGVIRVAPTKERDVINWTTISHNAAMFRAVNGKSAEAETIHRQILKVRMKVLGLEHPDTLTSMNDLAFTLWAQGKNDEAETINRQTLETRTKPEVLGAEHPDTLTSMNSLATTLWAQGKDGEAETMNRQVLEARIKALGAEHPDTLTSMSNLAITLWTQGKNDEAETINRQTLQTRAKPEVLGAEHPATLTSMSNLAHTLWSMGEHLDATALLRECIRLRDINLGPGHPVTQASIRSLDRWASKK